MSATSLSRRSGIRAPSGTSRAPKKINLNALPRPRHPTTLDAADESASITDPSESSLSLNSEYRTPEEAREETRNEEDIKIIGEDEQDIHTRLLFDTFSREYRPSFDSIFAQSGGSNSRNAIPHSTDTSSMKVSSPSLLHTKSQSGSWNLGSHPSDPPQHHPEQHQPPLQLDLQHFPVPPTHQHNQPVSRRGVGNITIPPRKESIELYVQYDIHSTSKSRNDGSAGGTISRVEEYHQFLDDDDDDDDDVAEDEVGDAYETPDWHSEADSQEPQDGSIQRYSWWFDPEHFYDQSAHGLNQEHLQYLEEHSRHQLHDRQCERNPSPPTTPILFPDPPTPRAPTAKFNPREQVPTSIGPVRHFNPQIETQETLKRERTRILQRTVVSTFRQIHWDDISNVKPLKKGGFGEIHTAEWSRLQVVLKRALLEESQGVEQFDQELEILKRVHDYDFIVPFYGVTVDPRANVRCIVMKHCANGNLSSFLQMNHETLTWPERYRLSIEITKGLEFLHKSGFYHRDLHSGNILLDDKRTAMICDFGLSRSSSKENTNDLSAVVGVASFMAPERFPTIRPIYSAACDVYSLGVIFWHISSGRIPFAERLRDPSLLSQLMKGVREEIEPGTPQEYTNLLVKCWDVKPVKRLKIEVIIAILQTLMATPSEPVHQMPPGFVVPSSTTSGALPMPPELDSKMASLERASNALNKMVFDIKDPSMKETVNCIERTRASFRDQQSLPKPYSPANLPKTPIYLCPLVGDIDALHFHLTYHRPYNPINESSELTGDTALHLACLFLESPLDTIKVLVELGADINLENLQGYTPIMILVSSNTQDCYEALKYFIVRGARIPAYIRNPITPLNSAQIYAQNVVNGSKELHLNDSAANDRKDPHSRAEVPPSDMKPIAQRSDSRRAGLLFSKGRPLIHVVAAMQDDYRILDCLCEAGLDPAISFGGETALVVAAAHLRIKNLEWLLNNDLDISTEAGVRKAIQVVQTLHASVLSSYDNGPNSGNNNNSISSSNRLKSKAFLDNIRNLRKYSWAGVAFKDTNRLSKDMAIPVLQLLEQWTGNQRTTARREVATKLKLIHGASWQESTSVSPRPVSPATSNANTSVGNGTNHHGNVPNIPPISPPQPLPRSTLNNNGASRQLSPRKSQRHLIHQVLSNK